MHYHAQPVGNTSVTQDNAIRFNSYIEILDACSAFARLTTCLLAELLDDPAHRGPRHCRRRPTGASIATGFSPSSHFRLGLPIARAGATLLVMMMSCHSESYRLTFRQSQGVPGNQRSG